MKRLRPHPILTGIASTMLVALACAAVLLWKFAAPGSVSHAAPPATPAHSTPVTELAHHEAASTPVSVQCIPYPAADADPSQNCADLYLPAGYQVRAGIPLVALVHGGSWAQGVNKSTFNRLASDLASRGLAVYNLEYRRVGTGGGWSTTFTDVAGALDHLPAVAARYPQISLNGSVIFGHSAGGQLATWAGLRSPAEPGPGLGAPQWRPSTIISLAGPLDMRYSATHGDTRVERVLGGTPDEVPDRYRAVDPFQIVEAHTYPGSPRIIAVHGTADHYVSPVNSERFIAEYQRHGGRGVLKPMPGQTHTSMLKPGSPAYNDLVQTIAASAYLP